MRAILQKLLACCLLFCLMLAPARAEMPVSVSERYEVELDLLNRYLQRNTDGTEGLDIHAVYEEFAANGNIGEFATEFMLYAEVLCFIEDGDFAAARRSVENLQSSASFEAFRTYLQDGEELTAAGRFAIRPLDELEAYVLARECEAQGRYAEAAEHYDYCQKFFDSYARMRYALSVTPAPTPTPSPTPEPTPAPSNILASRFVERFPNNEYYVRTGTREIRFLSTLRDAPADAIDVSQKRDGSVRAWLVDDVLYIAANGVIYAPENSSELFAFSFYGSFRDETSLEAIDFGGCFDTSNVTDMSWMFFDCSSLTELDVSGFDTSNVTDMSNMFAGCSSLTELDLSGFDTSNVTDMSYMFCFCESLMELDLSDFDTSIVTDMSEMFSGCKSLMKLDVSGFDTGNVTDMSEMFYDCENLFLLDTSNFNMRSVVDDTGMFINCPAANGMLPALQRGDEGERVHFLQVELVERNFLYAAADGIYGAKTEQAVSALQEMAGFPQTGAMDEATWRALTRHEARFEPQSGIGLLLYDVEMIEGGRVNLYFKNMGDQTATGYEFEVRQCNASKSVIGNFNGYRGADRSVSYWNRNSREAEPGEILETWITIIDGDTGTHFNGEEYTVEIFSDGVYLRATQTAYTTADGRTHAVDGANLYCEIVQ